MKINELINEALDNPYPYTWVQKSIGWIDSYFGTDDGSIVLVNFFKPAPEYDAWGIGFERDNNFNITGQGDAHRIFTTVIDIMFEFVDQHSPEYILFSSKEQSRTKLYNRLISKLCHQKGYTLLSDYPDVFDKLLKGHGEKFILGKIDK